VAIATGLQGGVGDADSPSEYVLDGGLSCEAKHLAACAYLTLVYVCIEHTACQQLLLALAEQRHLTASAAETGGSLACFDQTAAARWTARPLM
jgi:hypothetical protein